MSQTELLHNTGNIQVTRNIYTMADIKQMVKPVGTVNKQVSFNGWSFCSFKNEIEYGYVIKALYDALNYPEKWESPNNTYGALLNLQKYIKGNNAYKLHKYYGAPPKYEYRNTKGVNCIVDANNEDKKMYPLIANEILDIAADLKKKRTIKSIYQAYNFYHDDVTIEMLEEFKEVYCDGRLDKLIRHICHKSNELGGFHDHGVENGAGVIRNRLAIQYISSSK